MNVPAMMTFPNSNRYLGIGIIILPYTIASVTSEDPAHLAENLATPYQRHDPTFGKGTLAGKGWQTRKFCDFPQSLTLKFPQVVRLKTLQFLSHESKISSRVEIHIFDKPDQIPTKVGHFSFENGYNVKDSTKMRELKTVHMNARTDRIQLVCYDPYENKDNIFSQIGIVSISAIGEAIEQLPPSNSLLARNYGEPIDLSSLTKTSPIRELINRRAEKEKVVAKTIVVEPEIVNLLNVIKEDKQGAD